MKSKKFIYISLAFLIAIMLLLFLLWKSRIDDRIDAINPTGLSHRTSKTNHPTNTNIQNQNEPNPEKLREFELAFLTPITFYGKVVDQYGDPVPQANVRLAANDKPWGKSSKHDKFTNGEGLFSIAGIRGISLFVEVSKPGYHQLPKSENQVGSGSSFPYSTQSVKGPHRPDKENPVMFVLYKQGVLEPLIKIGRKQFKVSRDGMPTVINLNPNLTGNVHQMTIKCWNKEKDKPPGQRQYDWTLEIAVHQGGLIQRKDSFDFIAPLEGYQPSEAIQISASLPLGEWRDTVMRSYFVKFNDGVMARVDIEMIAHGDHFAMWKSYLNPKAGSRNLESDSK
ncbi:carboxypeptidase regulatory-like domain-containing protein [Phragmitibacter flavus]|uniref:Carboxypeptidase regulatory-like domain-containing protein n=1 Tax=Phragmitibacter flavus TaxID=2576071 RepID=A0A5R8KKF1_9BACT|nr:carboxypeptidase-like regulatory domain-containing protein [Phragmitibacter flavus]TLD72720.1 carboxypeptidase regulatory-like domain-containing protein [Phragmitibacter flavus]